MSINAGISVTYVAYQIVYTHKINGYVTSLPGALHAMDCTDIVIGAARGSLSRVLDYYTRDRATPRPDEVYGGTQSLTAAIGEEVDGRTTIIFRRKITGRHCSYPLQ